MKELRVVGLAILLGFFCVGLSAFYWGVIEADRLYSREDNPRLVEERVVILRGSIYDEGGVLLASTGLDYDRSGLRRLYPHPETAAAVGYYSLRYGASGVEGVYDSLLRGAEGPTLLAETVRQTLHQPAVGGDVRLTLNIDVQQAAAEALGSLHGAVVMATLPDGKIRAMVSMPYADPNFLDENHEVLAESPDAPLLNRVTQGLYQPGSLLQSVLLATALSHQVEIKAPIPGAADPIQINGLTLACSETPPSSEPTLLEAYQYGCPAPFADLTRSLTPAAIDEGLWRFGLLRPPVLAGLQTESGDSPLPLAYQYDSEELRAALAGQSTLTVTPLQALDIIAAIANRGNVPPYRIVEATRLPGESEWQAISVHGLSRAVLTARNARTLRDILVQNPNPAINAVRQQSPYVLFGQTATAYSGPEATPLQWFLGMVEFDQAQSAVVVVVLENAAAPAEAVQVGVRALLAAAEEYAAAPTT